jgi:hypothetical protein
VPTRCALYVEDGSLVVGSAGGGHSASASPSPPPLCAFSFLCAPRRISSWPGAAESDLLLLLCSHRRPIALFTRWLARCLGRAGPITIFSGRMLMQKGTLSTGTQRVKRGSGGHHSSLWFSLYSLGACLKIAFLSLVEKTGAHRAVRSLVRSSVRPRSSYSIRHLSIFIFVLSGSHACVSVCVRASGKANKECGAHPSGAVAAAAVCKISRVRFVCAPDGGCLWTVRAKERERETQTQIGSRGLEPCQRRIYT